ncbi:MAG: dual specificity protein phosphatase [Pirellulales bacterium]
MRRVPGSLLWIGHAGDGRDAQHLLAEGIEAVVQLAAEEPPLTLPRELVVCRIPLLDGADNDRERLQFAVRTVGWLLAGEVPTLVCCSAGLSRSPAVVAAALGRQRSCDPERCLGELAAEGPLDVSPGLWMQLQGVLSD